jgi:uncharacterized protein YacL
VNSSKEKTTSVPPLWRSKRFIASSIISLAVGLGVFWCLYKWFSPQVFNTNLFVPTLGAFLVFSAGIAYLPKFIVRIRDGIQSFFSTIFRKVVEDFFKERAKKSKKSKVKSKKGEKGRRIIVLDTSAIIDARFLEVAKLGFMQAEFVVPQCVLDELHEIADSKDDLRRLRGRRGLDVLKELKKVKKSKITTGDYEERWPNIEVDKRLVRICKSIKASLLTVDFNLNKVSGISGVEVLNVNDLVNAIKAPVIPGEVLEIKLVQKGKEDGQAVGYLEDGTMVVVESGESMLGKKAKLKFKIKNKKLMQNRIVKNH